MASRPATSTGRRRVRPPLVAFVVASVILVPAISAAASTSAAPAAYHPVYAGPRWSEATTVAGLAALDTGGDSATTALSCGAVGDCAAGGYYTDAASHRQPFVVDETDGTWGSAVEVPGLAALTHGDGQLVAISCAAAGDCTAGGNLTDASAHDQAFVVTETDGVWGTTADVPGLAALDDGGDAWLVAVSCAFPGDCSAAGSYQVPSGFPQGFVVDEVDGTWGDATSIPGLASLAGTATVLQSDLVSISCGAPGDCSAGGRYVDEAGHTQAFVDDEVDRVWGNAIEVPGTGALNTDGGASVNAISCAASGSCSAVGTLTQAGHCASCATPLPFTSSEVHGVWGAAALVRGVRKLGFEGEYYAASLLSVSCPSPGDCGAGGDVQANPYESTAFTVDEVDGVWGAAVISGPPLRQVSDGALDTMSCALGGACVAGGATSFFCTPGPDGCGPAIVFAPYFESEVGGRWSSPTGVPGLPGLELGGTAAVADVSCPAVGRCSAGGYFASASSSTTQAFLDASAPLESQRITMVLPHAGRVGARLRLTAHATSRLAVRFSLGATSLGCTIVGGTLRLRSVGRCLVDATQPGDATFAAAPTVQEALFDEQTRLIGGFAARSATLSARGRTALAAIESSWPGGSVTRIAVIGYSNPGRGAGALSLRRADVVARSLARWLATNLFAVRIHVVAKGSNSPVARAGAPANDRVVVLLS